METSKQQITWCCFLNRSGYAQAALDYIGCLSNNANYDIKVSLFHSEPERVSLSDKKYIELMSLIRKPRNINAIQFLHCVPEMQERMPKSKKTVGFATFETFSPPNEWVNILNKNDAVICPSLFNVKIFENAGVKNINYIPHTFDEKLYNPSVLPIEPKDERFTFMFVGTWKKRKGYQQLLEAWMQEFDTHDNVRLIIKTNAYTMTKLAIENTKRNLGLEKKEIAPILVKGEVFNESDLPSFFKLADCFISPTLGEGFGLPGLQCMALGIPVITTNFSGVTDYAKTDTATLIEPEGFIVYSDLDTIHQFKNKKWAHITVDNVRKSMRHVLENPKEVQTKANNGLLMVKENFKYEVVANKIKQMCEKI